MRLADGSGSPCACPAASFCDSIAGSAKVSSAATYVLLKKFICPGIVSNFSVECKVAGVHEGDFLSTGMDLLLQLEQHLLYREDHGVHFFVGYVVQFRRRKLLHGVPPVCFLPELNNRSFLFTIIILGNSCHAILRGFPYGRCDGQT